MLEKKKKIQKIIITRINTGDVARCKSRQDTLCIKRIELHKSVHVHVEYGGARTEANGQGSECVL